MGWGGQEKRGIAAGQDKCALFRRFLQRFQKSILSLLGQTLGFVHDPEFPPALRHAAEMKQPFEPAHGIRIIFIFSNLDFSCF